MITRGIEIDEVVWNEKVKLGMRREIELVNFFPKFFHVERTFCIEERVHFGVLVNVMLKILNEFVFDVVHLSFII